MLILISCFLLFGCNKVDSESLINKYKKVVESNENYSMSGELSIVSNEELYYYNVKVDYKEGDYYKASLTNKDNSHEQIILKNDTGVYVITPSLNKSFKFQSEWPNNSSQAYILDSLLKDLMNDSNVTFESDKEHYYLYSTVNYPNNSNLISQKVTFSLDMIPQVVEVYDKDGNVNICFKISKIDFDVKLDKDYFMIENNSSVSETNNVSYSDEVTYPMYLPVGAKFKSEETVNIDDTKRVILTFGGEKSFTLIEEVSNIPSDFEVTNVSGEFVFYENVIGNLTDTSLSWNMDGKDYYLISNDLTNEELLKIASSTSVVSLSK